MKYNLTKSERHAKRIQQRERRTNRYRYGPSPLQQMYEKFGFAPSMLAKETNLLKANEMDKDWIHKVRRWLKR